MAIVVETLEQAAMVKMIRLDRKLWLNADKTKVVEDGDPEAAFLYGIRGHLVPENEAIKLGAVPPPEEEPLKPGEVEPPKKRRPAENKMAPKAADK